MLFSELMHPEILSAFGVEHKTKICNKNTKRVNMISQSYPEALFAVLA
jgi:hypothetical protein